MNKVEETCGSGPDFARTMPSEYNIKSTKLCPADQQPLEWFALRWHESLDMAAYTYNPSTRETEAGNLS